MAFFFRLQDIVVYKIISVGPILVRDSLVPESHSDGLEALHTVMLMFLALLTLLNGGGILPALYILSFSDSMNTPLAEGIRFLSSPLFGFLKGANTLLQTGHSQRLLGKLPSTMVCAGLSAGYFYYDPHAMLVRGVVAGSIYGMSRAFPRYAPYVDRLSTLSQAAFVAYSSISNAAQPIERSGLRGSRALVTNDYSSCEALYAMGRDYPEVGTFFSDSVRCSVSNVGTLRDFLSYAVREGHLTEPQVLPYRDINPALYLGSTAAHCGPKSLSASSFAVGTVNFQVNGTYSVKAEPFYALHQSERSYYESDELFGVFLGPNDLPGFALPSGDFSDVSSGVIIGASPYSESTPPFLSACGLNGNQNGKGLCTMRGAPFSRLLRKSAYLNLANEYDFNTSSLISAHNPAIYPGDSGGAWVFTDSNGTRVQIGITSYGGSYRINSSYFELSGALALEPALLRESSRFILNRLRRFCEVLPNVCDSRGGASTAGIGDLVCSDIESRDLKNLIIVATLLSFNGVICCCCGFYFFSSYCRRVRVQPAPPQAPPFLPVVIAAPVGQPPNSGPVAQVQPQPHPQGDLVLQNLDEA